ncbi:MAG TPA: YncE family protein [Rhizomicrobium sp.]|jgi:YVTN family beta-propeller protein
MRRSFLPLVFLSALVFAPVFGPVEAAAAQATGITYTITKTIPLGPPDRWDYMSYDAPSGRLYVSHGDRVTVVDGKSGAILGAVEGLPGGTHGIAIAPGSGRGYTDDGKAGIAASFDVNTFRIVHRITAEPDADGVLYDPPSGHIFVIDGDSGKLTAIDPKTDSVIANIDGGGGLEFGLSGDNGKLYINGAEKNEIVRIDTATNKADAHWPLPGCQRPHGIALDHATHRLFSSCVNKVLLVVNSDTGAVVATLPIGAGSDAARFDPTRKLIFSSNREGTLSVISEASPNRYTPLAPVATQFGARTMALDPQSGRIYLVTADFTVNPNAAASDARHRYTVTPGSVRLLFLDPALRLRQGSGGQGASPNPP